MPCVAVNNSSRHWLTDNQDQGGKARKWLSPSIGTAPKPDTNPLIQPRRLLTVPQPFQKMAIHRDTFTPQQECKRRGTGVFIACHRLRKPTAFSLISIPYNFTCFSVGLTASFRTFSPSTLLSGRYGIPVFRSHTLSPKPKRIFFVW